MKQNVHMFLISLLLNNNLVTESWNSFLILYLSICFSLVAEYRQSQNIIEHTTSEISRIPSITKSFH